MNYNEKIYRLELRCQDLIKQKETLLRKIGLRGAIPHPRQISHYAAKAREVMRHLSEARSKIKILKYLEKQEKRMPKEKILELAKKIKPLMRMVDGQLMFAPKAEEKGVLYWLESQPIHCSSFTFAATGAIREAEGLQEIARMQTYHKYGGFYGFLKPSVDDAILQCPKNILDKVCAFEFVVSSFNVANTIDPDLEMHRLVTVYYTGKLPDDIAKQKVQW